MKKIYKYSVELTDIFTLDMPKGAQILSVQEQYGEPQIWAIVDPKADKETRRFRLIGTGHPIEENTSMMSFLGTFQLDNGEFVGHLFELL
jgi:hypothetical protein